LEDVGPDSAENGHALQEFDPRLLHGDTARVVVIMIFGGSVRKEVRRIEQPHPRPCSQYDGNKQARANLWQLSVRRVW
jgi:hypothetical protein